MESLTCRTYMGHRLDTLTKEELLEALDKAIQDTDALRRIVAEGQEADKLFQWFLRRAR